MRTVGLTALVLALVFGVWLAMPMAQEPPVSDLDGGATERWANRMIESPVEEPVEGGDDEICGDDELADELVAYCAERELLPHILSEIPLRTAGGQAFGAVPFGAMQRLPDLARFTLKGRAMGRLRYLVKRFGRDQTARTEEYRYIHDFGFNAHVVRLDPVSLRADVPDGTRIG